MVISKQVTCLNSKSQIEEVSKNKSLQAGSVLPSGAYLHLHHSDGSSSQGEFNISDLNGWSKMIKLRI
jgi:hypothetical protein